MHLSKYRRTKIVCTLGPASKKLGVIKAMVLAGMDVARLNFSHGDHTTHADLIAKVRKISSQLRRPIPILQDLQGPRFRVGKIDAPLELRYGSEVTVGLRSSGSMIPIAPRHSFKGIEVGHRLVIGDRGVTLRVISTGREMVVCVVTKPGVVESNKGVQFLDSKRALPALTSKDRKDVEFGIRKGVDLIALSFVRSAEDVLELKRLLGRHEIGVIAKIETREAVEVIDEIIDVSDGILVARGDLAGEISIERLPIFQKMIIAKCNRKAKPVITATQMLESMVNNPQPTRAEASDVANAVIDGSDAVMLSGETANGAYPVEAVKVMAKVIKATEKAMFSKRRQARPVEPEAEVDETIAFLAADAAERLGVAAIITSTRSGSTALRVSKFRPSVPIFAVTPSYSTLMKLTLAHGVIAHSIRRARNTDEMIRIAIEAALKRAIVKKGDLVVITAGVPPWIKGATNLLKLERVGLKFSNG